MERNRRTMSRERILICQGFQMAMAEVIGLITVAGKDCERSGSMGA